MRTQTENRSLTEISTRYYGDNSSSAITRFEGMNQRNMQQQELLKITLNILKLPKFLQMI